MQLIEVCSSVEPGRDKYTSITSESMERYRSILAA